MTEYSIINDDPKMTPFKKDQSVNNTENLDLILLLIDERSLDT